MADDGHGDTIQIPSLFISEKSGETLEKYFPAIKDGEDVK